VARGIGLTLGLLTAVVFLAACGAKKQPAAADGLIAFTSNRDGNVDIYVMAPDGSGQRRLTGAARRWYEPAEDRGPAWSPDGKRIAFSSDRVEGANGEVFVMNADGGDQHQLTSGSVEGEFGPVWSPDGKKIAFESHISWAGGSRSRVHVMNADGSDEGRLTTGDSSSPTWSPDGSKIALVVERGDDDTSPSGDGIYVMNADGSGQRRLTDPKLQNAGAPAWSPDGKKIAFESRNGPARAAVYVMSADGSGQRRLTDPKLHGAGSPTWSPDGNRIAFLGGDSNEIYVMNADGSRQRRLTRNPADDWSPGWPPVWSPDGTRIAFTRGDPRSLASCDMWVDCNVDIYVMNADGSDQRRLTSNPKLDEAPVWSSGG
jgi:Tol biopolymer transport system component